MEVTSMQLYWILKLDSFLIASWIILLISSFILTTVVVSACAENITLNKKAVSIMSFFIIISGVFITFVPSTKQMCTLLVIPPIINNEDVQKLHRKILELSTERLYDLKNNNAKSNSTDRNTTNYREQQQQTPQ